MTDKIYRLIEEAGRVHNELAEEFDNMASKCYMAGDYGEFYHWILRAKAMKEENYRLVTDLGKIIDIVGPRET